MKEKEIKREQIDITACVPCLDELCESTHDYQQSAEKLTINANKLEINYLRKKKAKQHIPALFRFKIID